MKLKHLIEGYNSNGIPAKLEKEIEDKKEKAGVIKFNNNINMSYLLDNEGLVIAINLFANCITKDKTINKQLEHTIEVLNIIQKTIEILANTKQEEANNILRKLGIFSREIETKSVRFIDHIYKIEIVNSLLLFSIILEEAEK